MQNLPTTVPKILPVQSDMDLDASSVSFSGGDVVDTTLPGSVEVHGLDRAASLETVARTVTAVDQAASKWYVLLLAYQSTGVIYGDLGTSPLYVFSSTFTQPPSAQVEVLGAMSLIFWTITLIGLLKYVVIVLNADDNGEGGTAALYTLLCRHARCSLLTSQHLSDTELANYKRRSSVGTTPKIRTLLEKSESLKKALLLFVMLGSSMVMGDGILTPAISVLSAIEGIQVEAPGLSKNSVVIITCAVLLVLFLLQRDGTDKVGFLFAPIIITWLILIAALGIHNVVRHDPSVFKSMGPHYAIKFFLNRKKQGWTELGGILLCITGTEAMFADLGHFSRPAIQIAFAGVVYPCLILAYFGQAAYLTAHPENVQAAFFKSVPRPVYWPTLVIATLATIVASQAMISGAFSVIKQTMALGCFPRVKVIHTSKTVHGQIYIPEINYMLMLLCMAVVIGFGNTAALGHAYGIAVVSVMLITSILVALVMLVAWQWPPLAGALFLGLFGAAEGIFLSAALVKVPGGGWVPLLLGASLMAIMCIWYYGTSRKHKYDVDHTAAMDAVAANVATAQSRLPGVAFFYSEQVVGVPPPFTHLLRNMPAAHEVLVFVCVKPVPVTAVLPEERLLLRRLPVRHCYQCVLRYGYTDTPVRGSKFDDLVMQSLGALLRTAGSEPSRFLQLDPVAGDLETTSTGDDLKFLRAAREKGILHVIGRSEVRAAPGSNWLRRLILDKAYAALRRNCRSSVYTLGIPPDKLIEVGMIYNV